MGSVSVKTRVTVASGALTGLGSYTVAVDDCIVLPRSANANGGDIGGGSSVPSKTAGTSTIGSFTRIRYQNSGGQAEIWYARVTGAGTLTMQFASNAEGRQSCEPLILTGVDWAALVNQDSGGSSSANQFAAGGTTTVADCVGVLVATDWNDLGTPTSSDLSYTTFGYNGGGSSCSGASGYKLLAASGAWTGDINGAGSGGADWDWVSAAFKFSAGSGSSASGSITFDNMTSTGTATATRQASGAITLAGVTSTGTATQTRQTAGAITLAGITSSGVATPPVAPGAPLNVVATPGGSSLVITHDPPASDGGASITDYVFRYRTAETTEFSDTFTQTDSTGLTSFGWTNRNGSNTMQVTSNKAVPAGGSIDATLLRGNVSSANQWVQATVRCDDGFAGVQLRIAPTFRNEGADFVINPSARFALNKHTTSTETELDSVAGAGDIEYVLRCEAEGNDYRGYVDGVLTLSGNHSDNASALGVGIGSYRQSGTLTIDSFSAGALAGAWSTFSDGTSGSTGTTITGLTPGVAYEVQVAATNSAGTGPWSSTASGTPTSTTTASGSITLAGITSSGVATETRQASGSITLAGVTSSGVATDTRQASGSIALAGITSSGVATETRQASGSITLAGVTSSGVATETRQASGSIALAGITSSGVATPGTTTTVSGAITLADMTASGTATATRQAAGAITLAGVTSTGVATVTRQASGAIALEGISSAGTATVASTTTASGSITLEGVTAAGVTSMTRRASGAIALAGVSSSGTVRMGVDFPTRLTVSVRPKTPIVVSVAPKTRISISITEGTS